MKFDPFSVVVGFVGLALVWYGTNWQTALGVFVLLWSHNMERHE
jgi:hypothetical protein